MSGSVSYYPPPWLKLDRAVDNVSRLVSDLRYQGLGNFVQELLSSG